MKLYKNLESNFGLSKYFYKKIYGTKSDCNVDNTINPEKLGSNRVNLKTRNSRI